MQSGIGNTNNNYFEAENHELTRSNIYTLLKVVLKSKLLDTTGSFENYSLKEPAELNQKLIYNKAFSFKKIFLDYSIYYDDFEKTIELFENSEKIIIRIHTIFLGKDIANYDNNGNIIVADGDQQLNLIYDRIIEIIKNDPDFKNNESITDEDLVAFVYSLMMYTTSKCKILINPL